MVSHPSTESPLSGGARFALVCGAGLTILLSYLFSILAIVFLLALLGVELLLLLVLLRFGLSGVMARVMERHVGLIGIFFRSFRLRKGAAFQLSLQPSEAPGLFAILAKLCSQLNVALPREVALQMGVNAWVQLKGYRRGAGKTVLGIGFDLLAGLSAAEVESVLAHEMVHAKLIQRGFRSWLNGGLGRLASLSGALSAQVHAYRSAKLTFDLAEFFLRITDSLTRLAARLVATYSRQDEFDADRGAAELCGAATVRSMLVKLDPLHEKTSRLPWNQRVAQLQLPEGFSKWLVKELVMEPCLQSDESVEVFDKYSTHPLIRDRLAALPVVTGTGVETVSRPAIELLAEPDAVAAKLIAEIQRVLAEEEQKDSKELRRWARKRSSDIRPVSLLGFFMVLGALIGGGFAFFGETSLPGMGLSLVIVIAGVFVFRLGKYKDRVELPVPDFGLLKAWRAETIKDFEALQKQIETELRERITKEKKKRKKVLLLSSESYEALGRCDYLRAHVAARLCQEIDNKSVEAFLSIAVASAALKMSEQSVWA
ncbi:MAG: Zn-dependent protease with chaperone function, partial [Verrucomicrobiales bacterium]|nr:Zn-dependent protease with chaperone function [Verrucomicrobiales bacterium]